MKYSIIVIVCLVFQNIGFSQSVNHQITEGKWLGLNNLFFKNKDVFDSRTLHPGDSSILVYDELKDHQFSFGFSYRKVDKKGMYQQFDLLEINWMKNKDLRQLHIVGIGLTEPTRGKEFKEFSALVGYQRGKLFSIAQRLTADVGVRGFAWYKKTHDIPVNSLGYPVTVKSAGLGLNLELGLNYQIHNRINIGYNFVPVAIKGFWNEHYNDNPILPRRQKFERGIEVDTEFLDSIIDLRNFNIRYVF